KALSIFDRRPFPLEKGGLEPSIISIMERRLADMHDVRFSPLEFPLTQNILIGLNSTYLPAMSYKSFLKWKKIRHVTDEFTVNKHHMIDRSQDESDRQTALKKRKHQDRCFLYDENPVHEAPDECKQEQEYEDRVSAFHIIPAPAADFFHVSGIRFRYFQQRGCHNCGKL